MRIQTDNGLFDLIFIASAGLSALLLIYCLIRVTVRRKFAGAAIGLAAIIIGYGGVLVLSNLLTPWQDLKPGTAKCSDEWCVTVDAVQAVSSLGSYRAAGHLVVVHLRIFSELRGRPQRGSNPAIYLVDANGTLHEPSTSAQNALESIKGKQPELNAIINPGEAVMTLKAFDPAEIGPNVRVLVEERPGVTKLIWFNEAGFWSGKSVFVVPVNRGGD